MKRDGRPSYISSYPKLKKWLNTCVCCGAIGYKPEMPAVLTRKDSKMGEIRTAAAHHIRRFYSPLKVNEVGLCEDCERVLSSKGKDNN